MEYKSCLELRLYSFYYTLCEFIDNDVFLKAHGYNVAVGNNYAHRHGVIADRIVLILYFLGNRIVKDYERLSIIAFNTGGFFLIEGGTDKVTVDIQFFLKQGYLCFCRRYSRYPAAGLHCFEFNYCVLDSLVKFQHNVPLFCTESRYATTTAHFSFCFNRFPQGSAVIVFHLF